MYQKIAYFITLISTFSIGYADIKDDACNLQMQGFKEFKKVLDNQDLKLYSEENNYISKFPLNDYKLINVAKQGQFFIDTDQDLIKQILAYGYPWEQGIDELIDRFIVSGSTVIDIGAHIGTHVLAMSKACGHDGKVYAFEPSKKLFREMCYNLAQNKILNAYPIRAGIGNKKGYIDIVTPVATNEGGSFAVNCDYKKDAAILIPLDDLELKDVCLIKIDVENMEKDVLDGAKKTILKYKPVLIVEIQGNDERPSLLNENSQEMRLASIQAIKDLGYELFHIRGCDYLALPKFK
jgi:FkbM family methyltransferase